MVISLLSGTGEGALYFFLIGIISSMTTQE